LLPPAAETLLDAEIARVLTELDGSAPLLARMIRYHLGIIDASGDPTTDEQRHALQGKRLRPAVAMLAARAVGGSVAAATPLAAAIELLHNFTLIHDDIQDRSPNRRHRATVWRVWGDAQAINAGDALFAAGQLTLLATPRETVDAERILDLVAAFNRTTIDIVQGQVLDVGFEGRSDVTPTQYLEMITGKTAAIVRFAGIGFQIRDDLLGVWGDDKTTGKTAGDDIRRRKQSLPILLLRDAASADDLARLDAIFSTTDDVPDDEIAEILELLDRYDIQTTMNAQISASHDRAEAAFAPVRDVLKDDARAELGALVARLADRES
jgi:geranylgeranyl diphosphate synthase type I